MTRQDKNLRCPACPQTSRRKWNLKVHYRRKHQFGSNQSLKEYLSQNYQNATYDRDTVSPSSIPIDDPIVGRLIRQYEDRIEELNKRCKELESTGTSIQFDNYVRVLDLMQTRSRDRRNEAENLSNQLLSLVITGIIIPVLTGDANGNFAIRYEPRNPANTQPPMYDDRNDLTGSGVTKSLEIFAELLRTNHEILLKFIKANEIHYDIEMFDRLLESTDLTSPLQTTNTETDRSKQEKRSLENDQLNIARRAEESEKSKYEWNQEMNYREDFIHQDQIDKPPTSISGMTTNYELPVFSEYSKAEV